ncbi:hypothetical protein PoB_006875000, partial [Plakobranchus ocellatus]
MSCSDKVGSQPKAGEIFMEEDRARKVRLVCTMSCSNKVGSQLNIGEIFMEEDRARK